MRIGMLTKLALTNIQKRGTVYFPYFMSFTLLMSLEYIMASLMNNSFVQERHPTLPIIIGFAIFVSTILITIFTIYANNFIQKQRRLEYGLYTVLGLERKHISMMMLIEQFVLWLFGSAFAVGIGYVLGKLFFIFINRLMKDTGANLMDYPFDPLIALLTVAIAGGIMFLIYLINFIRISRMQSAELLQGSNAGEKEPKANIFVLLIGLVTLGLGYYFALTITNAMSQLGLLFGTILLIIIGTYCLFISLSIFILKNLQKRKGLYYKPENFLMISGMLYRMRANAVSLASIAILCTGIIVTVGTTLSLYMGMETIIEGATPRDFEISYLMNVDETEEDIDQDTYLSDISKELGYQIQPSNTATYDVTMISTKYQNGVLTPDTGKAEWMAYLLVTTVDDFNELHHTDYQLAQDQALYTSLITNAKDLEDISLQTDEGYQREFDLQEIDDSYMPSNYVGDIMYLVVPDEATAQEIRENFPMYVYGSEEPVETEPNRSFYFDLENDMQAQDFEQLVADNITSLTIGDHIYRIDSKKSLSQQLYSLNGGFLFLGMIVGAVLVIGTILMLYFKQVSEGYDDKEKFDIMEQIGLPDDLIKRTIRKQVFWIFALPSLVAVLNAVMANRIVMSLLQTLGMTSRPTVLTAYAIVIVVFMLIYAVCYLLTSRMYYSIIKEGK